jgi:hypothetical protein
LRKQEAALRFAGKLRAQIKTFIVPAQSDDEFDEDSVDC